MLLGRDLGKPSSIAAAVLAASGSKGGSSGLSPLVQSYTADFNVNRPYGSPLPRPDALFAAGAFGPMSPVAPMGIDAPRPDSGRPDPRRSQYPVGWNLPVGEPGSEGIKLASFATLRSVADMYSVARACVDKRINEIVGLGWDIVPTAEAVQAMKGDPGLRQEWETRRQQVVEFFTRPDSDRAKYPTFESWLSALLEDRFVIDAVAVHLHPPRRKGGGPFGSDLASLDLLDGTTIRPLLNLAGETPRPPAVAYQAYYWGVPRVDMISVITANDVEVADEAVSDFRADQLIYLRENPRNWTPYGFSCVEKALLPISIGLGRQQYQQDYFTEGSVPAQFITPGPDITTPQQIRQLQDALNAMAGDIGAKHRIIVLPPGSKSEAQKHMPLADQFDEWIVSQVAMPFGLTPMDLGVTPRVSAVQSPSESRELSQINNDKGSQTRMEPVLTQLKSDLFDYVIHEVFRQGDMEWSWGLTAQGDRRDEEITQHVNMIKNGMESIDEARVDLGMNPWGLPETSVPLVLTATGPVPLSIVTAEHQQQIGHEPPAPAEQPNQPPQQVRPELSTPAHDAAIRASSGTPPAAKATKTELEIFQRYLRKGHDPARFISEIIPSDALAAAGDALPKGVAAAVQAAQSVTTARQHQQRRTDQLHPVTQHVAAGLSHLMREYRVGRIAAPAAVDAGVAVMTAGYDHAMSTGSDDASGDHPDTPTVDFSDASSSRAEDQRGFLAGLLNDALAADALGSLSSRLTHYALTLTAAYNTAYGQTVQQAHPDYQIVWHLGVAEHCRNCIARDGTIYTFQSLPGYPGDGGFGGPLCQGGPHCACSLEYREGDRTLATGTNTQRAGAIPYYQQQLETITQAREDAQAAREAFLSGIPADTAARAHTRDSIRQDMADQANQRTRSAGGYPGVTVEAQDIPTDAVADVVEQRREITGRMLHP